MNKLTSIGKTSAVFLAIVLVSGTIAAISPLSFIKGGNAQAQPYYGMDSRPNSYGASQYTDKDDSYNSYESDHYGMDNNDKKSYGNDNSYDKPQYHPSYKADYKPKYPSYGEKDDRGYKSNKDKSKSIEINKLNCINTNININGNNTGDISLGNKEQEGYLGANAYDDGEGNNDEGYYYDGQNYKNDDKGFDCIINNNNTNTNIVAGAGDNQTTAPKATLNVSKIVTCTYLIGGLTPQDACGLIEDNITENQFLIDVTDDNPVPSSFNGSESGTIVTLGAGNYAVAETFDATSLQAEIELLEAELKRLAGGGAIEYEISGPIVSFTGECTESNINFTATGTIAAGESQTCGIENHFDIGVAPQGGLTASFYSSQPTIAQETEDDLSALEKITKLKQQWLDLLP